MPGLLSSWIPPWSPNNVRLERIGILMKRIRIRRQREIKLADVRQTCDLLCAEPRTRQRWQQEGDEQRDDSNHNEKLDQRKRRTICDFSASETRHSSTPSKST